MKLEALSKRIDLGTRRIQQLVRENVLPRPMPTKGYNEEECVLAYIRYLRKQATGQGGDSLIEARTKLALEQAEKVSFENRRTRGEICDIDEAADVFGEAISILRSRILCLGDRLAVHVVGCSDVRETKTLLDRYAEEMLTELSEIDVKAVLGSGKSIPAEDGEVEAATPLVGKQLGGQVPEIVPGVVS